MSNLPKGFRPMKGDRLLSLEDTVLPAWASTKVDGYRCIVDGDGTALSSSLAPIRNAHIRRVLSHFRNLDGEIIVGPATGSDVYSRTVKAGITREEAVPDFTYLVFDSVDPAFLHLPYADRLSEAMGAVSKGLVAASREVGFTVRVLPSKAIRSHEELHALVALHLDQGYEGTMVRRFDDHYKFGKSSIKQALLLKIKPYDTDEAHVVELIEGEENRNEATKDALGRTKRSSKKGGKVPSGTLGKFRVKGLTGAYEGKEFFVGTGTLTKAERQLLWNKNRDIKESFLRNLPPLTFTRCDATGGYELPRHANFLRWRSSEDMTSTTDKDKTS